jgi:thioredoxin-related protein
MTKWLILLMIAACQNAMALEWLTDANAATAQAKTEHKFVLLDFTGSDWCGWCKKLKKEVFDQPEFDAYALRNAVMVEVDFPQAKYQSDELKSANRQLAEKYHITGYPTIIVLNGDGQLIGTTGYVAGGPAAFIAELEKIPGMAHNPEPAAKSDPEPEPKRHEPVFVPIAPATPTHYGGLSLKGLSGSKDRRLAIINNQTMMAGETAKVKVNDQHLEVTLREIRENSVVIVIAGQTQELKLHN